jgi:hypothetical protein
MPASLWEFGKQWCLPPGAEAPGSTPVPLWGGTRVALNLFFTIRVYELWRSATLAATTREQVIAEVREWLVEGLKTWGAGAKTAAGYGYFEAVKP